MSVIIRGMAMPSSCSVCEFAVWSNLHQTGLCRRAQRSCSDDYSREYREKRAKFCPIEDVDDILNEMKERLEQDAIRFRPAGVRSRKSASR